MSLWGGCVVQEYIYIYIKGKRSKRNRWPSADRFLHYQAVAQRMLGFRVKIQYYNRTRLDPEGA